MIRQYRHPVGYQLWEIPAGLRDVDGEPLLATAQRELREETGYQARDWRVLLDTFTSPGFTTERVRIFLARGVSPADDTGYEREDEEKFLVTNWVPLAETVRLALAGKLHNGETIAGVLAAHARRGRVTGLRPRTRQRRSPPVTRGPMEETVGRRTKAVGWRGGERGDGAGCGAGLPAVPRRGTGARGQHRAVL